MYLSRIDTYILKRVSMPLLAVVGVSMAALMLERLIRVLDLVANKGGPFVIVLKMMANLIPHYLGMAIPASLFIGILYAGMRLSADSELDAMGASGISLRRILVPILALTVIAAIGSTYVIGFLQPYTRFGYNYLKYIVTQTAWDSAIERGAFFTGFGGKTILVEDISDGGRTLTRVFVKDVNSDGNDIIITAENGELNRAEDLSLVLVLRNGVRTETERDDQTSAVNFSTLELKLESETPDPFRQRGEKVNELNIVELARSLNNPPPGLGETDVVAEFNARLVHSVSVLLLPFLALPIGISSRRTSKSTRVLAGILLLISYYQIVQFGKDAVTSGYVGPLVVLWMPCALFAALSLWLFHVANAKPGADPLSHVFEGLSSCWDWTTARLPHRSAPGSAE